MKSKKLNIGYICLIFLVVVACNNTPHEPKPVEIVKEPENLNKKTYENIKAVLQFAHENKGELNDSVRFGMIETVQKWYDTKDSLRTWSDQKQWNALADSLYDFIKNCELYGLFPMDYHFSSLRHIHQALKTDSASMMDAAMWARADVMFTDAFVQIAKHLKLGRLEKDSITLRKDTTLPDSLYVALLQNVHQQKVLTPLLEDLEPQLQPYRELRHAIKPFLDSMDRKVYTYITYPLEIPEDSALFLKQLQARLYEGGYIAFNDRSADTAELAEAVRTYQEDKKLKVDGKAGPMVVGSLNDNDRERFTRIAINLDRYKLMTDTLPRRYVWVNIPSFKLRLWDADTLKFESKVVVGQPATRTPVLTSEMTNFIIFPQWTVPYSIIFKEMLPKIQKNVGYLDKQNLMVVDKNDSIIDPATINWFKLNKNNFPYLLKQREGDDNSLGVIKFNFRNKYSVYLHDTNARGLFARSSRALSHGCVRVQQWEKLYKYLVKNDSVRYKPDTLAAWMKRKEKHTVNFSAKIPVFIRYFSAEANEGKIIFYEDIYADDKLARNKYFVKN
ncbi:MAG: L,D-transpeptidase family protein [Chitinophagaceae bacterium]|nr:L,D-transpeptidase family protein [Chitinophagaceae bacterium]